MAQKQSHCLSFAKALQTCTGCVMPPFRESVTLDQALRRVTFLNVRSSVPKPSFDESIRDGYVVSSPSGPYANRQSYAIVNEIPAGKTDVGNISPGQACRIMTGGLVPAGGERVVPSELCKEMDGEVSVEEQQLRSTDTYIRRKGSEIAAGTVLVPVGVSLQPAHLELLSSCGIHEIAVSASPRVGSFCTGSELTVSSETVVAGQKSSSNSLLLDGLVSSYGGRPEHLGIIEDRLADMLSRLAEVKASGLDMVISTGGMGPGKYDLVERAFVDSGGTVLFNALDMRPGKSLLFGILGKTLYFGLPGPPPAVKTLFHALVGPTLMAMQGVSDAYPRKMQAFLQHDIGLRRHDLLRLKDGMLSFAEGKCLVRLAGKLEISNCSIYLLPGKKKYSAGELVEVHLTTVPA